MQTAATTTRRRAGFSFTEVLFAVMILGLGFIMVAAMFPVTIRQTQETMHDTVGANLAKAAAQYLQSIATDQVFPATKTVAPPAGTEAYAPVRSLVDGPSAGQISWVRSRGNYISPQNPRYAWTALYRRDETNGVSAGFAQVFIIGMKCRNRTQYEPIDIYRQGTNPATLEPRRVKIDLSFNNNPSLLRSEITFRDALGIAVAAPGAYVIIADDTSNTSFSGPPSVTARGVANGRIYQLGNPINQAAGTWELAPGGDMIIANNSTSNPNKGDDIPLTNTDAYIIGRGYTDIVNGNFTYSGPAQDIAVYTTFIRVN